MLRFLHLVIETAVYYCRSGIVNLPLLRRAEIKLRGREISQPAESVTSPNLPTRAGRVV